MHSQSAQSKEWTKEVFPSFTMMLRLHGGGFDAEISILRKRVKAVEFSVSRASNEWVEG